MTFTCSNCSRTFSRLDNLKRHEKHSCLAKTHKQDERDFNQISKVTRSVRLMLESNRLIDKDRKAIPRKHKIFKLDDEQPNQEASKPQFSPLKNLPCITLKSKDEMEPPVKKQKVESEEFGQYDRSLSMIKNDADDEDVKDYDNDDDDDAEEEEEEEEEEDADEEESDAKYKIKAKAKILDYWEDPNKFVDRLRFLIQDQLAGNVNNVHEIISIVNEMREIGIIE